MRPFLPILCLLLVALPGLARAQETPYQEAKPVQADEAAAGEPSPWWFRIAPYAWLTATSVDATVGGTSVSMDGGFANDVTAMGILEVGCAKWSLSVDGLAGSFSGDNDWARLDGDQTVLTAKLNYRSMDSEEFSLLVFLGARYTDLSLDLELDGRSGGSFHAGDSWVDPVVGLRGRSMVNDRCYLGFSGEIGGFGVSSDFVWQAFVGLGYQLLPGLNAVVGYRGLGGDRGEDGFSCDAFTHGPVLGIEYAF